MPKIEFIHQQLASINPPPAGRVTYFEDNPRALPGFALRVTDKGIKSWILMYRTSGKQRLKTYGKFPALGIADAKDLARADYHAACGGDDPAAAKQAARTAPTMQQLADRYLAEYAAVHKRPKPASEDRAMLTNNILPRLGAKKVADVERQDIEALHRSLKTKPYRANRVLALLSKMFNLAEAWHYRPQHSNPCQHARRYPEEKRDRWLSADELKRLVAAIAEYGKTPEDLAAANAIKLLVLTGARRGEVLAATWDQFDLERGVWTKPSAHTKQKKTEHVPLSAPAVALLTEMKLAAKTTNVFPNPRADLRRPWATICKAAGLDGVRQHDLRHTFASHLASGGVPLGLIGKLLGHTQAQTTARYAHVADDPQREAANKFGELFTSLAAPKTPPAVESKS